MKNENVTSDNQNSTMTQIMLHMEQWNTVQLEFQFRIRIETCVRSVLLFFSYFWITEKHMTIKHFKCNLNSQYKVSVYVCELGTGSSVYM